MQYLSRIWGVRLWPRAKPLDTQLGAPPPRRERPSPPSEAPRLPLASVAHALPHTPKHKGKGVAWGADCPASRVHTAGTVGLVGGPDASVVHSLTVGQGRPGGAIANAATMLSYPPPTFSMISTRTWRD